MPSSTRSLSLVVVLTLAISAMLPPQGARAFSYRYYSVAFEQAPAYALTGVLSIHADLSITVSPGVACTVPYDDRANPVFLTQWVTMSQTSNQIEIGTGHQCDGVVYQFWGYRVNGTWEPIDFEYISPTGNGRYFEIFRLSQGGHAYWHYRIQGLEKAVLWWDVAGYFVDAGLETSDVSAVVPNHWFSELQKTSYEGPWTYWGAAPVSS